VMEGMSVEELFEEAMFFFSGKVTITINATNKPTMIIDNNM